jgi:hypothetical protein
LSNGCRCSDSHSKALYKALQCFLLDFWNHQECRTSPDWDAQEQLYNLPAAKGQSKCIHLFNGGRICMVHAVLGERSAQLIQLLVHKTKLISWL